MANTFTAPFAQTPKTASVRVTTATPTDTTVPGQMALLATAGADGALLTRVSAMPNGTVTASGLHLYISHDAGDTVHLLDSIYLKASSADPATASPIAVFERISESDPIRLQAAGQLYAGLGVGQLAGVTFTAQWTDF